MKFSCETADFLHALQLVSRAISSQQALPILGNILIEAEGKRCRVSATDLELSIVTSFLANIENEGAITVPAKAILNFAQYNSDKEVLLETSEGAHLRCTSKHAKTVIAGESSSEYPTIGAIEKETSFQVDAQPFLEALHKITFACARSTIRPVLSGVFMKVEKGRVTLVATDSYRLSEYVFGENIKVDDIACIIPAKVLEELSAVLSAQKADKPEKAEKGKKKKDDDESTDDEAVKTESINSIQFTLSTQQIEAKVGHTTLLSRLIDGKFPDYQQIIPKEQKTTAVLSTKELTMVVKRMHYFAKEINNNLTFTLSKDGVHITTPQTQSGKDEATLTGEVQGDANKIALSSSYILDLLSHTDSDQIELRMTNSMQPALFHLPGHEKYLHLIMPLRLQEEA